MASTTCQLNEYTNLGSPTKYLQSRLRALQDPAVGEAIHLQISLAANWQSILSAAR
jgi:hypothetical protein